MNIWLKRSLFALTGGTAGFVYYYFIGCASGACPITSNPYISTAYGILVGSVAGWTAKGKKSSSSV